MRLFKELEARNRDLTESLEQRTATSEILRVISRSPTDIQPVFDAIAQAAMRLCEGDFSSVARYDGELMHLAAHAHVTSEALEAIRRIYPMPPNRATVVGRAVLQRAVVHLPDVQADAEYPQPLAAAFRGRSALAVPMLREGHPIGSIGVGRFEARRFTDAQIALLQTFADQAVIAIENARLFKELEVRNRDLTEALEQQTATSEILRVISQSQTDAQAVFDAIARSAVALTSGDVGGVLRTDGQQFYLAALHGSDRATLESIQRLFGSISVVDSESLGGRVILSRTILHVPDMEALPSSPTASLQFARMVGFRSQVIVPMLRGDEAVGAIAVGRREPGPFPDSQIELLKTFADQAVIAIENVRLFKELQASNRELRTALDTQTATSEILSVISRSQTDVQPVFDAIIGSVVRLLGAHRGTVTRLVGDQIVLAALTRTDDAGDTAQRARFPMSLDADDVPAQVMRARTPLNVADALADPRLPEALRASARLRGYRSLAVVPMLRHDEAVGTIAVARPEPGGFNDDEIGLLQTFADQAVIAIENVRLFNETKDALERQTATSEILRVISGSPTDVQPVFDAIVQSASRLCNGHWAAVLRFDGELIHLVAQHNMNPDVPHLSEEFPCPPSRRLPPSRAIAEGRLVHIPDAEKDPDLVPEVARRARSFLVVPMLREGAPMGAIAVSRPAPGPFPPNHIDLLTTFAGQAVIAIENVRLFTELQEKNRALTEAHAQVSEALEQQTATADILRVISSSPTDLQPVLDAVAERAARLCNADDVNIHLVDGDTLRLAAQRGTIPTEETRPIVPTRHIGRAIVERRTIHVHDMQAARDEFPDSVRRSRTALATPLLRQGSAIGVIQIRRLEVQPFSEKQVKLLETFADQAVIAIENARLFKELEARNRDLTQALEQQTATSELLKVIGRSTFDLQPVFETLAENEVRLCEAERALIYRLDRQLLRLVAAHNVSDDLRAFIERNPIKLGHGARRPALPSSAELLTFTTSR